VALKRAETGSVSQEQCGGILRRASSGMVKIKFKSLFLREGALKVRSGLLTGISIAVVPGGSNH
jgi:hypothetical protein